MPRPRFPSTSRLLAHAFTITAVVVAASAGSAPLTASAAGGQTRMVSGGAGGGFQGSTTVDNNAVESPEIFNSGGSDGAQANDRSHSSGGGSTPVGAVSQPANVTASTPNLVTSFAGLNHFENRFVADGGRQFSLEPPDQGLCVGTNGSGGTDVMETLNDVVQVFDTTGAPLTAPTGLNPFMNEGHAIIRSPVLTEGEFETDPSCIYDAQGGHWFVLDFAIDTVPTGADAGHFTGASHLNLAVSNTSDPVSGGWTVYHIPTEDDGTNGTPSHGCSGSGSTPPAYVTNPTSCFADFPHIGSDSNGIYMTTNEYSFFGPEFHGAQIYAMSKSQVESLPGTIALTQFDTHGMDTFGFALNGFTLWPTTTPGGGGDASANGTEYFLSSNAGAEAHDTGDGTSTAHPSTQLLTWALTNTASLSGTPALTLSNTVNTVGRYATPPASTQKSGETPLRDCMNQNKCSTFLEGQKDPFAETEGPLDSSDTRMLTAEWVNGQLWGALGTAVSVTSNKQAGIEWFKTTPTASAGSVTNSVAGNGYLALGNDNLIYPTIGITSGGTGVMGFTAVGSDYYPSAGYALIGAGGPGAVHIAAAGAGPQDGFSEYKFFGPVTFGVARPRWGDYGYAVPWGGNVWIANEYIDQSCSFSEYLATNFRCNNTRTALGNWSTRISEVAAP